MMTASEMPTTHLRLSTRLTIEAIEDDGVIVYHPDRGSRLKLSRALFEFLRQFGNRSTADATASELSPSLRACIATLEQKGYLVADEVAEQDDAIVHPRPLAGTPYTLFRCPPHRPGAEAAQVSVLGVPCDFGTRNWPGARLAPEEIRLRSYDNEYRIDFQTGRPIGWFDVQRKTKILEGVTFSDWGDIHFQYGEPLEEIYGRTQSVVTEIVNAGSFPVVLGGDHAISYPVVAGIQQRFPMTVLYLDAHTDFKHVPPGASHNHASTARRIVSLPNVERMIQVGHRGYTLHNKLANDWPKLDLLTLWDVREHGSSAVVDALPEHLPCYISIDIDVIDPIYAPATSNVTPGGFTPDELKSVLLAVGKRREILGMDICGVNPERDLHFLTSRTICHLLLAGLGACLVSREQGHSPRASTHDRQRMA